MTKLKYDEAIVQLRNALNSAQESEINDLTKQLLDEPLEKVVVASSQDDINDIVELSGISQESIDAVHSFEHMDVSTNSLVTTSTTLESEEF